jgi:hypothetical protein
MTNFNGSVCKIGQGVACCRYVVGRANGMGCAKLDGKVRPEIDKRADSMKAKGDNCDGVDKNLTWSLTNATATD